MTDSSPIEILAQANAMGLKLSDDGKSWVPKEDLVVKVPPSQAMKTGRDSVPQISRLAIYTSFGTIFFLLFIIGILNESFLAIFLLFGAMFFLTPMFFHLTRPMGDTELNTVGIGHPVILNQQALHQQKEQRVMRVIGTVGLVSLVITIIVFIILFIAAMFLLLTILEFLFGSGGSGF